MIAGKGRKPHYNSKDCFMAWVHGGTLKKAQKILVNDGVKSSTGGTPPIPSIQRAAKRYVTLYPEKAREFLISRGFELLQIDSEWYTFLIKSAAHCFGKGSKRFKNWLVQNELWEVAVDMHLAVPNYNEKKYRV